MKLSKAIDVFASLQALGAVKLPAKAGYRIGKAINKLRSEIAAYEEERNKLLVEFGNPVEDITGQYQIPANNVPQYNAQIAALVDEECNIELPTVTMSELGSISIEPMHLAVLEDIVLDDPIPPTPTEGAPE